MTSSSPSLIDDLLRDVGTPFGDRANEHPCEGALFHSPQPLTTQLVDIGERQVHLCPTCTSKLQVFVYLAQSIPRREFTWPLQREFGNHIRALGNEQLVALGVTNSDEGDPDGA